MTNYIGYETVAPNWLTHTSLNESPWYKCTREIYVM